MSNDRGDIEEFKYGGVECGCPPLAQRDLDHIVTDREVLLKFLGRHGKHATIQKARSVPLSAGGELMVVLRGALQAVRMTSTGRRLVLSFYLVGDADSDGSRPPIPN